MMERTNVIRIPQVMRSPSSGRPHTDQGPQFRNIPIQKDSANCIWITQEILSEFKSHVVKSSQVTIRFNTIKGKPSNNNGHNNPRSARKLPPLFAERLRMLNDKTRANLGFNDNFRRRPVKVIVDDITQIYGAKDSLLPPRKARSSIQAGSKTSDVTVRSMESGDDGDFPNDVIETVARANSVQTEMTHVLPEIRAAPCPLHVKKDKAEKTKGPEPTFLTNSHFREPRASKFQYNHMKNISSHTQSSSHDNKHAHAKNSRMDINVRLPEQFPSSRAPVLPKNMSSKDYVMTWLIHGSEPTGSNHFPELIPSSSKRKSKTSPRKSYMSE